MNSEKKSSGSHYRDLTDNAPPGVFQSTIENDFVLIIVYFRPYFFTNCLSFRLIMSMSHGYLRKSHNIDLDSFFLMTLTTENAPVWCCCGRPLFLFCCA